MKNMPSNLTIKQESFCQEYLKKGSASEAYRGVYNARNMKVETIHRKAAELMERWLSEETDYDEKVGALLEEELPSNGMRCGDTDADPS